MEQAPHPPRIVRPEWADHPRYPSQALLLGSHRNFRRVNALLIERTKVATAPAPLESLYRRWIVAMRSHERYEEHKLYPYLAKRWGVSFEAARAGHDALHEKHAAVLAAFRAMQGGRGPDQSTGQPLVSALEAHQEVLTEHLQVEEDLVIPLLLELSPAEFHRYYHSPIDLLLDELEGGTHAARQEHGIGLERGDGGKHG